MIVKTWKNLVYKNFEQLQQSTNRHPNKLFLQHFFTFFKLIFQFYEKKVVQWNFASFHVVISITKLVLCSVLLGARFISHLLFFPTRSTKRLGKHTKSEIKSAPHLNFNYCPIKLYSSRVPSAIMLGHMMCFFPLTSAAVSIESIVWTEEMNLKNRVFICTNTHTKSHAIEPFFLKKRSQVLAVKRVIFSIN